MTKTKQRTWSTYRKLMSNLVPALVFVPVFATGIMLFQKDLREASVVCFAASVVIGMFSVNLLGLFQNRRMQAELKPLIHGRPEPHWFVGIGKAGALGALDPHDDLGFLLLTKDALEYVGESARYRIPYVDILSVSYKMNAHSLLGLGRWIAIEGRHDGKPFRMLLEPRNFPTILRNKKEATRIVSELRKLLQG
ncbi:MAG: hypothetical protein M3R13_03075 [Armatimonadota bacterium]|nr:hypothetical protein [Armatimonadota bacterium]